MNEPDSERIESDSPAWEPEPFELPLVMPHPRPQREERPDDDAIDAPGRHVIIIDLA